MVLKIRRKDLDKIQRHARKYYPLEACGILVGRKVEREKIVEKVYATRNILESGFEYKIDPSAQLKIFEKAEIEGLDVLGFYHSHPFSEPFWSEIDEEGSKFWIGYSYLIVSAKSGSFDSYITKEDGVEKEEVKIL